MRRFPGLLKETLGVLKGFQPYPYTWGMSTPNTAPATVPYGATTVHLVNAAGLNICTGKFTPEPGTAHAVLATCPACLRG